MAASALDCKCLKYSITFCLDNNKIQYQLKHHINLDRLVSS